MILDTVLRLESAVEEVRAMVVSSYLRENK